MDDTVQRALRELRRSGASWREVVQALAAECQDLNVSEKETAEIVSEALRHKVEQRNFLDEKCTRCGHPKYWHGYGVCREPQWKVLAIYGHTDDENALDGFWVNVGIKCEVCCGY